MLQAYQPTMRWIADQQQEMIHLLTQWAQINSASDNIEGLDRMADALMHAFGALGTQIQQVALPTRTIVNADGELVSSPLGKALRLKKHPHASKQVFLAGHMDTVFPQNSPFQNTQWIDAQTLRGPGVADMKGGLVVLLTALRALENSPWAGKIGWEVLINPDEEIGSPGSDFLFLEAAARNHIGLIFEPSFPDGTLVSSRKGSINFTAIARGRAAHVGRDFHLGRNALTYLARFFIAVDKLTNADKGITVNIGRFVSGGPANIVPDLALGKMNIRMESSEEMEAIEHAILALAANANREEEGLTLKLVCDAKTPPKPFGNDLKTLFHAFHHCADTLGIALRWKPTGGACDGCRLYAAGLPNIDTLGVVGGNLHTAEEYVLVDSLRERTQLTALFLMQWAAEEINPIHQEASPHA